MSTRNDYDIIRQKTCTKTCIIVRLSVPLIYQLTKTPQSQRLNNGQNTMKLYQIVSIKNGQRQILQSEVSEEVAFQTIDEWWNQLDHNGDYDEEAPELGYNGEYGYSRDNERVEAVPETKI